MKSLTYLRYLYVPAMLLLLMGCAGGLSEPTGARPAPTQPVTAQVVEALPTATPTPVATAAPVPTHTPTIVPTPTSTATSIPEPTATPTAAAAIPYRVSFVTEDDALNLRAGPGVEFDVLATLPPQATGVQPGSAPAEGGWVEISWQNTRGWVNRYFLTEGVSAEAFCRDPAPGQVVENFRAAIEARDGAALAKLIHPERGLLVRLNWWNTEVRFQAQDIPTIFVAETAFDWGYQDGSGAPIAGSFTQIILPVLDKDLAGSPQIHCNDLAAGGSAGLIQLPFEYSPVNYYAIYRPAQDNELDWGTWVLGIEYWEGKPFLSFLVHYQWEI